MATLQRTLKDQTCMWYVCHLSKHILMLAWALKLELQADLQASRLSWHRWALVDACHGSELGSSPNSCARRRDTRPQTLWNEGARATSCIVQAGSSVDVASALLHVQLQARTGVWLHTSFGRWRQVASILRHAHVHMSSLMPCSCSWSVTFTLPCAYDSFLIVCMYTMIACTTG